jgi:hypothetical protein
MRFFTLLLLPLLPQAHEGTQELTWKILDIGLPKPLSDMTATLRNGIVYLAGGCDATTGNSFNINTGLFECASVSSKLYAFHILNFTFDTTVLPPLPRKRYRHGAALSNGKLWLVGGRNATDDLVLEVDVFDFADNAWSTPGSLEMGTSDNAAFADGDHVYVVGGYNADYVAYNNVWRIDSVNTANGLLIEQVAPLLEARGDFKAVADGQGQAYIAGGYTDQNGFCPPLATVEMYSIESNTWSSLPDLLTPRGDLALEELQGHLVAISGETQLDTNCQIIDPDPGEAAVVVDDVQLLGHSDTWEVVASLPDAKFRFDTVSLGGRIFAFGGQSSYNATCQCYPTSDEILVFQGHANDSTSGSSDMMMNAIVGSVGLFLVIGL